MNITLFFLSLFDYLNKRKIISFFKNEKINFINFFIDVGAHKGETYKLFEKNFEINEFHSFEASPLNYKLLENFKSNLKKKNLFIYNKAVSDNEDEVDFFQLEETSSSTMNRLNLDSQYYKKKNKLLNLFRFKKNFNIQTIKIKPILLSKFINKRKITIIDILKIDTEGNEYRVIKGLGDDIKKIKYIYFEHHFDDMIKKGYTLSEINSYLLKFNFRKIFKIKMYFRKTYEYIYINNDLK